MNRTTRKNLFIILLAAIFAVASIALAFLFPTFKSAYAAGNDSGSGNADIPLVIDLNGKDATIDETLVDSRYSLDDTVANSILYNNKSQTIRTRYIKLDAIIEAIKILKKKDLGAAANYSIDTSSVLVGSSAIAVEASGTHINVSPKQVNDNTEITSTDARFSIVVKHNSDPTKNFTVTFSVHVKNEISPLLSKEAGGWSKINANDKSLLVGGILNNKKEEQKTPGVEGHEPIKTVNNFSKFEINFATDLKNRALYCNADADDTSYSTALKLTEAAFWGLSSVNNIEVISISLGGATNVFTKTSYVSASANPKVNVAPVIKATLNLTSQNIRNYIDRTYTGEEFAAMDYQDKVTYFWNSSHNVIVKLRRAGDTSNAGYDFMFPMTFTPSKPQFISDENAITTKDLSMNVSSVYTKDKESGTFYKTAEDGSKVVVAVTGNPGYRSLIIRPSDIVDYSVPGDWATGAKKSIMMFNWSSTGVATGEETKSKTIDGTITIERYYEDEKENSRPTALLITMLGNRSVNVDFAVDYYIGKNNISTSPITYTLMLTGYGNYSVKMDTFRGRTVQTTNVLTDSRFAELIGEGFQMTDAKSLTPGFVANFDSSTNMLSLQPNSDVNIEGAVIAFTFTNSNSQTITVETNPFLVDISANDFFSLFDADWKAYLAIAGIALGGVLIILFIVWIFIHSISKHRQEENATQAPVSSYIVKLNSTIAATQAQQRLAATQALTQASTQMLLGAGPTNTQAPMPDALQLASGVPSQPGISTPNDALSSEPSSTPSAPKETDEDLEKLIADYITDEELLERIFTEKYEPKGMVRRTFFKSKDLQARELEKEKKRIIERYKTPMPMDEAIMSENELKKAESTSAPGTPEPVEEETIDLGFDPDSPLYIPEERVKDEFSEEKIDIDVSPEESRLKEVERQNEILQKELIELKLRIEKVQSEFDKSKSVTDDLEAKIAKAEEENDQYSKDIEDLEFKLASAKAKEKDKINRDIKIKEEKTERNKKDIEKWRAELEAKRKKTDLLSEIMDKLNATQEQKDIEQQGIAADLDKAKSDFDAYQERLQQVKARQEMDAMLGELSPLLVAVNTTDYELRALQNSVEKSEKEREGLKAEITAAKAQILGTTDFDEISELNNKISDANARLSDIEKELTKSAKRKSDLNLDFKTQRRKANDYVEKNNIPLEELIPAEDAVIGDIELETLKANCEIEREESEKAVAAAQALYDDVSASSGDVTMIAMEVASNIKDLTDELEKTQAELDAVNAQMEMASDDEKLMLRVDQGDKSDKVEELKERLKIANVEGTKRKMEAQSEYDSRLDSARQQLDDATNEFKSACAKVDDLISNTNPLDLIMSGSGIISQDQKKREAENLKKQLEKSKNEIEQARLQAQMAQMEAEQAKVDAARASDEAKAEAERKAQEAMDAAETARREAEERARADAEAADQARREAEEAAETARREAEEATERARREAEEAAERARIEAEEAAERARREAEEAIAQAQREAEEATERARREAEEAAEKARREAEEQMQADAEEAKRKAQEEIDEMRRKAEEEAEAKRIEEETRRKEEEERQKAEADRKDEIAKKVAARKEKIVVIRERMRDIKGADDAKALREQLYTMQLTFDEDEHGSTELMDFYNKTMDDIQHAGEIADLKAENAKKPKRIVKKVTERVNRIPRKKSGSRPASGSRSGARPGAAHRPSSARPSSRPSASRTARPSARPGARPGARPRPSGTRPPRRPS